MPLPKHIPQPVYRKPNQTPLPIWACHSYSTPEEKKARAERMKAEGERLHREGWFK
jgi:hypothetical protein